MLAEFVDHLADREGLDHRARFAAPFNQVAQRDGEDAVAVDEVAVFVHRADSVAVAVDSNPDVRLEVLDGI
jgi:hypothetical protein